ncbi:MAG: helix-turn-helix domain-containing protein [Lachnospiraceae bacterium]
MQIGQVIRKYRKSKDMTQEEMANRLGVTAPAVNKWENGNSLPDITMLAPIARLLGISLDTLLTFQGDLTDEEVNDLIKILNRKLETEEFEEAFQWARRQMEQYPDCEHLLLWMSVELMGYQWCGFQGKGHDTYFLSVLQRLLGSGEETIRTTAAECLYNYYMQQEKYDRAETYLSYFSVQSPERKRKEALLYARTGRVEEAYRSYEELLFSESQILQIVFSSMMSMRLKEQDLEKAAYLAEKRVQLVRLFEMGRYQEDSIRLEMAQAQEDIEGTIHWAKEMTADLEEIAAFRDAPLYGHMAFREVSDEFRQKMQERLDALFQEKDSFEYMKGNERWENFLKDREK